MFTTCQLRTLQVALSVLLTGGTLLAQTLLPDWPEPNGPVHAIVEDTAQGVVFIGGGFSAVGPSLRTGSPVDRTTGAPIPGFPQPNDGSAVFAADGNGGWFMAGAFTSVDGQPRNRIAHVLSDGTLGPLGGVQGSGFDNGAVTDLEYVDNALYVIHAGRPNSVSGTASYTGPVDLVTGEALWSQLPTNGAVKAVVPAGDGGWYIGGSFTHVGGLRREGLARVSAHGAVHPWDAGLNGPVQSLALIDGRLYVGGCFSRFMGAATSTFAAFDVATEELLPLSMTFGTWNGVYCGAIPDQILAFGERLYIRGGFEMLNGDWFAFGQGWIDADSGYTVVPPIDLDGKIDGVTEVGDRYHITGTFTTVNGEPRDGSAVVDRSSWQLLPDPWSVQGGQVKGSVQDQGVLFLRGTFTEVNGEARSGLAAWDMQNGILLPWAPMVDGPVQYMTLVGSTVYALGTFTQVNGQVRSGSAAVDASSGSLVSWTSGRPNQSMPFAASSSGLFLGFSMLGSGQGSAYRLFALDPNSGEQSDWPVSFENQASSGGFVIYDIEPIDDNLLVSGSFTHVNGLPRGSVAMIDLGDGSVAPFSVEVSGSGQVRRIRAFGEVVALCGTFSSVNAGSRRSVAFVSAIDGSLLPFTASFQGVYFPVVRDVLLDGDTLYMVGEFGTVNAEIRSDMAVFRWSTAELLPLGFELSGWSDWLTWLSRGGIERAGDTITVFGPFSGVSTIGSTTGSQAASGVFSFLRSTGQLLPGTAPFSGEVRDLEVIGDKVLLGGRVSWLYGPVRAGLAALDLDDGSVLPFEVDIQGVVHAMAVSDGHLYLGGAFTSVNGVAVPGVARLNALTGELVPFVQPISWGGYSYAFEVHQGRVFMGSAQGLLVHDAVSGAPLPWNWTTNDAVSALDLLGDRLYIGGSFTVIGGVPRTRAAAVHLLADVLLPWVPIADAPVVCLSAGDKGIAMAGPTYGGMLVVDAFTGERLPVYRPFSDTGLIPCHVLSTHDDLLIAADPGTYTGAYSTSYSESYNMPNGGRSSFSLTSPGWLAAGTLNAYTPIAALQAITLTTDRIYMGGLFQQAGAHYRHNLAVFSRPVQPLVQLDLRASLGGVQQEAGLLSDALRAQGLLPAQEPYTSLGVEHQLFGGGEGVDAPVLAISDSTAVVDWVLVELRAADDPAEVLATRNGLLRRDGRVVDVDGRSALTFPLHAGPYHLALHHRNHLGAMTAAPVGLSSVITTVDLRVDPGYGTEGQQSVAGTNALWPGDATRDGVVKYAGAGNDRDDLLVRLGGVSPTTVIVGVYDVHDINLDGTIRYTGANNDRDIILQTIGGAVPTAVRVGQVP